MSTQDQEKVESHWMSSVAATSCFYFFFNHLCFCSGGPDHAGPPADPRTDRHAAPRAAAEHPHPQGADPENCQRGSLSPTEVTLLSTVMICSAFIKFMFLCFVFFFLIRSQVGLSLIHLPEHT